MANTSAKKTFVVLFLFAFAILLSSGVLVRIAHAQDDDGYSVDSGGDDGYSYDSGSNGYDGYSYDTGSSGYDGYSYDTDSASGFDGYSNDTNSSDGFDGYSTDCGSSDCSGGFDGYADNCASCVTENGVTYSEDQYSEDQYPLDSGTGYGYSTPLSIGAPGFGSFGYGSYGYSAPIISPAIPSAPIIENIPTSYQQPSQPNVTNNTCTNYSCNTVTTVSNSGNTTISDSGNTVTTVVPVAEAPVTYPVQYTYPSNYNYNYQNVSCSISASPNYIQAGQYTYLTWQSYGATSATLTNYGNVAPNGSLSVQPYGSMNYVLTVYGYNGQTSTCNVYVNVGSSYPSVTLSQIPYTGFDLGTFGDAMYFALLAAFALAAGYLLVYYRGGMGTFALAMVPSRKTSVSTVKVEKKIAPAPVVEKKTVVASVPAKASSIGSLPAFSNVRPTSDSMSISSFDGAPRIVINRA